MSGFQGRVSDWILECFGIVIAADKKERNHRFLEEAVELVQSAGCTQEDAHKLVDYVYGRPVGELEQEVGGVLVTLAALCAAHGARMQECGDVELRRCWSKIEQIRAKQRAKPQFGPLPGPSTHAEDSLGGKTIVYHHETCDRYLSDGRQPCTCGASAHAGAKQSMPRYVRDPVHDRRFARGDDFAGDAWRDTATGRLRMCFVGYDPNQTGIEAP